MLCLLGIQILMQNFGESVQVKSGLSRHVNMQGYRHFLTIGLFMEITNANCSYKLVMQYL